jgi:pSer/pThr/pTyr-binding forkhead associated (FHA) protein
MDALEKINKKFGDWYGKFFPSGEETGLQPAQIKRRLFTAMEDERTEGLDHNTYVPNVYTLKVAVASDKERQYVRTFLQADDLAQILADRIAQQGYAVKGDLVFLLEEVDPKDQAEKLTVQCAFDPTARTTASPNTTSVAPPVAVEVLDTDNNNSDEADSVEDLDSFDELGTVAAVYPAKQNALASLLITHPDGRMEEFALTGREVRIGRGKQQGNDLQLTDPRVSKRHAHISFENGMFVLYDDGSTNGTRINDLPLPAQVPQPLENGSVIQVGNTDILFQASDTKTMPHAHPAPRPVTPAAHVSINPTGIWKLVAEDGQVYTLASKMRLGKALDADLMFIADGVASDHAHLVLQGESYYIEDQGSSVGTRVNGEAIPAKFPVPLYDGDKIALGEMSLTLRHTSR